MSDTPETSPVPTSQPSSAKADLEQQFSDLRALTVKLQSSLIALTWLMIFFMFIQVWRGHKDVSAVRPAAVQWNKIIENGNARGPAVQKFITQVVDYARTHPDIQPLLAKYPIQIQAAPAATPSATAPAAVPKPVNTAPAPTTVPKK